MAWLYQTHTRTHTLTHTDQTVQQHAPAKYCPNSWCLSIFQLPWLCSTCSTTASPVGWAGCGSCMVCLPALTDLLSKHTQSQLCGLANSLVGVGGSVIGQRRIVAQGAAQVAARDRCHTLGMLQVHRLPCHLSNVRNQHAALRQLCQPSDC